jgi:hypothetical protein
MTQKRLALLAHKRMGRMQLSYSVALAGMVDDVPWLLVDYYEGTGDAYQNRARCRAILKAVSEREEIPMLESLMHQPDYRGPLARYWPS